MKNEIRDLELLVSARTPLILVETVDVDRAEQLTQAIAQRQGRPAYKWTLARGLVRLNERDSARRSLSGVAEVLAHIASLDRPGFYLMLDLHRFLEDPAVVSQLRSISRRADDLHHCFLLAAPSIELPDELRAFAARFELRLPQPLELKELIAEEAQRWAQENGRRADVPPRVVTSLTRNLAGLSLAEARRLVRNAIHDDGILSSDDLPELMDAKYRLLDQGSVLSFELDTAPMASVAGLRRLKRWLAQRHRVFTADKPPPGLDCPRGLLLLGVQGGGKSLAAKAVAGAWAVPLLRLDFATLYNKFVGETERNLREALKTAGLMAPCVLWIDEIEKGLAVGEDDGPGRRLLGSLLTWMAERTERVFLVATSNDVSALPPELMRKGRFDEIFFVDLPSADVRAEIFRIHLRKREQAVELIDCEVLAAACEGFTGAEIEQAVVSALYSAYAAKSPLETATVREELEATRPLSVVMGERVAGLRAWAAERCVAAD